MRKCLFQLACGYYILRTKTFKNDPLIRACSFEGVKFHHGFNPDLD
jgi:hypothetical protein